MPKKIYVTYEIIDKETVKRDKIIESICKECGKEALCGKGFCRDCKAEMYKDLFHQT